MFNGVIKFINSNGSYIPTEEDRENDRLMREWQERRREETRKSLIRSQSNNYQHKYEAE